MGAARRPRQPLCSTAQAADKSLAFGLRHHRWDRRPVSRFGLRLSRCDTGLAGSRSRLCRRRDGGLRHGIDFPITQRLSWGNATLVGLGLGFRCSFGNDLRRLADRVGSRLSLVNPVLCGASQTQWRIWVLILLGPFFAVSVLSTIGELWNILGLRRRGRRARLSSFVGYALLTALLGSTILLALSC